jgi:hypothetical protein
LNSVKAGFIGTVMKVVGVMRKKFSPSQSSGFYM